MKKKLFLTILFIIIILGVSSYLYIRQVVTTGFAISEIVYIEIDNNKDYKNIIKQIEEKAHVKSVSNFEHVSAFLEYPSHIKSGRYAIKPEMDILQVVKMLKNGNQTPVNLKFNNIRTKKDLSDRISEQLMLTESELSTALNDHSISDKYGFSTETIICMFIPNTYEIYWNISLEKFIQRMNTEYKTFWNQSRLDKAKKIGLTSTEVSILASIVEEECYFTDEYPIVAGLYINRLNKKQLLQADPTVKFAWGDFSIRRILNKHLEIDSPYNTYKYQGLPPGPIRMPSIKGIDSVLNYTHHNYYYMCAKEDFSGRHNFATTHAQHQQNATKYQAALNKRKIYQ